MDFKQTYSRSQYINFFETKFLPEDFKKCQEIVDVEFQPRLIKKVTKIGEVSSLDMSLYEIEHRSEKDARVTLSRESFRLLAQYGIKRALILFISQKSQNYRLSLVTIDLRWDEGRRVKKEYSNPRRYSFFLGPDTKTHTPEEYLVKKGRVKDFEDLKKRFSVEIVNKEFYTKIALLFTKLTGGQRTIGRRKFKEQGCLHLPSTVDDIVKKEFAVRLIGRLVFCWFLKKKCSDNNIPLLSEELLSSEAVVKYKNYYHNILEPLFFEVLNTPIEQRAKKYKSSFWAQIPFLNGGLFNPHHNDFYEPGLMGISKNIGSLKIPDEWFKELFDIFETYNFTIDENTSIDVELSIDPEMLGRIFENLLAEINPETGETARKATGSYYTPRPIVEYMVDESLKHYLLTKTNIEEEKISSLLSYEDETVDLDEKEKHNILDALDSIRIIDPACGSGAFPMGILQKMLLILQKIDPNSKKWLKKQIAKIDNMVLRKKREDKLKTENVNYIHKLGIIQNAIYGVDIQPIAVEISKLRFFLSLIVDEDIDDKEDNRGIEHLPNLEFKFVCANTLIGLPKRDAQHTMFEATEDIERLRNLREEYLRSYGGEKKEIERKFQEIQSRMFSLSLSWYATDSQTLKLSQWNPFSDEPCSWFDPEWMFGVKDGFDIVIGNPPYVRQEKIKSIKSLLQAQRYEVFNSTSDLYVYFYEKGYRLLKRNGILCFISSNKWMRAKYGEKLRQFFKTKTTVLNVIDFSGHSIFEATVDTNIILFKKKHPDEIHKMRFVNVKNELGGKELIPFIEENQSSIYQKKLDDKCWTLADEMILKLKEKIEGIGIPLKDWDVKIYRGLLTGCNEAFIIDNEMKEKLCREDPKSAEILKPILKGRDIGKYYYKWAGLWVIATFPALHLNIDDYPAIKKYLLSFGKERLEQSGKILPDGTKARKKTTNKWFETQDTTAYYTEIEKEKIVWQRVTQTRRFVIVPPSIYAEATTHFIVGQNLYYLLAILNSVLFEFIFYKFYQGGGIQGEIKGEFIKRFPIPKISTTEQQVFADFVNRVLSLTQSEDYFQNPQKEAKVKEYERQIDQMVYKLYGLSEEEIEIIEGEKI